MQFSRDVSLGMPLVDLKLSEGGPPCLHGSKNFNQQTSPAKQSFMLFKPEYYQTCPAIKIEDKSFTVSKLFE